MLDTSHASSILAFVTTLHLALVVLRAHRSPASGFFTFVTVISILFAASPWLMPSAPGLALGLAAHLGWFVACERLLPVRGVSPAVAFSTSPSAPPRTAPAVRPAKPIVAAAAPNASKPGGRPRDFVQTPVLSVADETPAIRTFRLLRPEGFDFTAGQFLTVRVRAEGREHVRCYSISSSPDARGYLEISVKRHGLVSGTLHATLRPGSMLAVRPPAGAFRYPAGEDRPLVMLAGGVGITPLMSMARHAVHTDPMRPVTLFYSVHQESDIAFREELMFMHGRHPQFRPFVAVTGGNTRPEYFPGRITDALVRATVPDVAHASCLICGPPPMIDAMVAMLSALGVPRAQIHYEIFEAAVAASAGRPAASAAEAAQPAAPSRGGQHQTRFERSGLTTAVAAGQSLLEASESCGASIPSLCRAGVCGTCRTRVISGDVECASQILDEQDRRDGYVLACVSRINSDCVVEA